MAFRLFGLVNGELNSSDRPTFFLVPFTLDFPAPPEPTPPVELVGSNLPVVYTKPQRLSLLARTSPGGPILADLSEAQGVMFATNEHGFAELSGRMPMTLYAAFAFYHQDSPIHMEVSDGREKFYEGRLETVQINQAGLGFTAYGYWRALSDIHVTAAFSDTDLSNWYFLNDEEVAAAKPDKYGTDKFNRLYMAPETDNTYSDATNYCTVGYRNPDLAVRQLESIRFSYRFNMPSPWRVELARCAADWSELETIWSLTGDGNLQQDTDHVVDFDPCDALRFTLFYNDTAAAYTGESGDDYLVITHVRVKSSTDDPLTLGHIARYLVEAVNARNPTQISDDTSNIGDTGLDLEDAYYEDTYPADILTELAAVGDSQNPPGRWMVAVWEDRRLVVQPQGFNAVEWWVDALDLEVELDFDDVVTAAYTTYNQPGRGTRRTAEATNTAATLVRTAHLDINSSSQALAETLRDTHLNDNRQARPRAVLRAIGIYDRAGVQQPLYAVRGGDIINVRNLPPDLGELENIRRFRVARTKYNAELDALEPEPETAVPTLAILVARHEKGIR